jgi:hypothetical protein
MLRGALVALLAWGVVVVYFASRYRHHEPSLHAILTECLLVFLILGTGASRLPRVVACLSVLVAWIIVALSTGAFFPSFRGEASLDDIEVINGTLAIITVNGSKPWIAVIEDDTKRMLGFEMLLRRALVKYADYDVLNLDNRNAPLWIAIGVIGSHASGLVIKRTSVPRVAECLDELAQLCNHQFLKCAVIPILG